jgi:probable rRNA maturation factor
MKKLAIHFFYEETSFKAKSVGALRNWIHQSILAENQILQELNFIFCSDDYLLKMNQQYLNHDTFTDVITFDHSEQKEAIYGDIFISIDRIKENAKQFNNSFNQELYRVMIHGTLHLLGYKDKKTADKTKMTEKENEYLAKGQF